MNAANQPNRLRQLAVKEGRHAILLTCITYLFIALAVLTLFVPPFQTALWVAILLLACSRYFFLLKQDTIRKKERLEAGLTAESESLQLLLRQLPLGWIVEASVEVPGAGDVDLFVTSPNKKYFAIEIKSHKTKVFFDGKDLRRSNGSLFEKDFLLQSVRASEGLRSMRNLAHVHTLLVFTRAALSLRERQLGPVTVLKSNELVGFLTSTDVPKSKTSANVH